MKEREGERERERERVSAASPGVRLKRLGPPGELDKQAARIEPEKDAWRPSLNCRSESHVLDAAAALVLYGLAELFLAGWELRPFCLGAAAAGFQSDDAFWRRSSCS